MPTHQLRRLAALPSNRWVRLGFVALVLLLVGTSFYTSRLITQQQSFIRDMSRYDVTWQTSQAAYEYARLQIAVGVYLADEASRDADELQLRLDIVLNRTQLLESGEMGGFLVSHPEQRNIVREFRDRLELAQGIIDHISEKGAPGRLLRLLSPMNGPLVQLSAVAHDNSEFQSAKDLDRLERLYSIVTAVLVLLILSSFILVGVMVFRNRLLTLARDSVQTLNDDLQRSRHTLEATMTELQERNAILLDRDRTLHTQNVRFTAALNNMSQALLMVDTDQRLIVANSRFVSLFGLSPAVMRPGTHISRLAGLVRTAGRFGQTLITDVWKEQRRLVNAGLSGLFLCEDHEGRALSVSHRLMAEGGWVTTYEDVTERRQAEAKIQYMAHHDALTNLPNRRTFYERLNGKLARIPTNGASVAVHCIDLDFFKNVNDTLGHPAGDALLEACADRLRSCVRRSDLVARLGGDEFAILQAAATFDSAAELAQRVLHAIAQPYELGGRQAVVGASIGIALDPGGIAAQQLFTNADLALYSAKEGGRNTIRLFEAGMEAAHQARYSIEMDLRAGIQRQELELHYQPILDLGSERVSGYEALVRWRSPSRGLVMPGEFIGIAEATGLIGLIGEWVIRQACFDAANWLSPAKVAVNLSSIQFRTREVITYVRDALSESGLAPDRLELEITESIFLANDEKVLAILHELRELGAKTVLDDFGTGYSSLSYLRNFPFDKIKMDQSFIRDMGSQPDCLAIVDAVCSLAHTLGMRTTAEGVETEEQMQMLQAIGFDEVQGFLLGRPAPNGMIEPNLLQAELIESGP